MLNSTLRSLNSSKQTSGYLNKDIELELPSVSIVRCRLTEQSWGAKCDLHHLHRAKWWKTESAGLCRMWHTKTCQNSKSTVSIKNSRRPWSKWTPKLSNFWNGRNCMFSNRHRNRRIRSTRWRYVTERWKTIEKCLVFTKQNMQNWWNEFRRSAKPPRKTQRRRSFQFNKKYRKLLRKLSNWRRRISWRGTPSPTETN